MIHNLTLFIFSSIIFILTPGIDTLFVVNKSLSEGRVSGLISSVGIVFGILVHTLFASLGLSVIISQSANAFIVLKYSGAVYLVFIGVKTLIERPVIIRNISENGKEFRVNKMRVFIQATFTNILNPKVALFFLAFFPQFVKMDEGKASLAFFVLGLIYGGLAIIWLFLLSYLVSNFSHRIKESVKAQKIIKYFSGIAFLGLGARLALGEK